MSGVYDNWERLVNVVLKREYFWQSARCPSLSSTSISSDSTSRLSFDISLEDPNGSRISRQAIPPPISYSDARPVLFKDLKKATRNFRFNFVLGQGGFGTVYKGWLHERTLTAAKPGSGVAVAVKKWNPFPSGTKNGREEWLMELKYLNQLRHPNLIRIVAYCSERDNLLLVYEFMTKGSMDNHLFKRGNLILPWATRIKVATGAARGLAFLHNQEIPVIHRGFKTADILLDREFNAKLTDFGLARDGPTGSMTHVSTVVRGRSSWIAPEYIKTGHLTEKCDVFGFGVFMVELLAGNRLSDSLMASKEEILEEWVESHMQDKRRLLQIMDPKLDGQWPPTAAFDVATIALQCLSADPRQRPSMDDVLTVLEQL